MRDKRLQKGRSRPATPSELAVRADSQLRACASRASWWSWPPPRRAGQSAAWKDVSSGVCAQVNVRAVSFGEKRVDIFAIYSLHSVEVGPWSIWTKQGTHREN